MCSYLCQSIVFNLYHHKIGLIELISITCSLIAEVRETHPHIIDDLITTLSNVCDKLRETDDADYGGYMLNQAYVYETIVKNAEHLSIFIRFNE